MTLRPIITPLAIPIAALAAVVACDDPIESIELRQVGTLRAHVTLPPHVTAVRVEVTSWLLDPDGQLVEHTDTRHLIPVGREAYALFALVPGDHRVVAIPLDPADDLAPGCARAEDRVTIDGPGVTELGLTIECEPPPEPES